MPKYRALTAEELVPLEKEFVDFLVLNGIMSDDWVKMKKEDPKGAEEMTEIFSDVVWEGILRKTKYLEHRTKNSIKCFHCLEDKIVLVGMDSQSIDMASEDLIEQLSTLTAEEIKIYTTDKLYGKTRENELYDMLNWGCEVSEGFMFKQLCLLL